VKPKEKELREGMNKCEEVINQLEINSTTTQIQINQLFNNIRIKLDEKERELLNKLVEIDKYKKKELEIQKEELKFGIKSIIGSCQMIEQSLSLSNNNKNDARLLSMKKFYHSRLNSLSNIIWKIEPCHNPFIEFSISQKEEQSIYSNISNIGIIDSNDISAEKCLILRDENQKVIENEEFKFGIISYSKEGNQIKKGGNGNKFEIQIEGELKNQNNEKCEWKIMDLNNGKYEVKMKLKDKGNHLIFVKYNGIDINSSPFQIQILSKLKQRSYKEINEPKLTFGSQGVGNSQFNSPRGIAADSKGNIVVCECINHRIQIFDSNRKFISTFGSYGNGNGQFNNPWGVAINSQGNILVCDYGNHRIQIFDPEGKFISTFGSKGNGNGRFSSPIGLCVDKNDQILVCEWENNRVQIFDSEGKFISTFGSKGNQNGQFNGPWGIAINSKGNILVSDQNNHKIQIFDAEGKFISTFGSNGSGNGRFNEVSGLCTDLNDNILVCDQNNNRVQIFSSNGEYITQFKVNLPLDITIDPNTQGIIVCGFDHKVSIF